MTKDRLHEIIFEADTREGKVFDIVLLWLIVASIVLLLLESVEYIRVQHIQLFFALELIITILFTVEYFARVFTVHRPWKYISSFWGVVDFLSILPFYLAFFVVGSKFIVIIRTFRLLRIFKILRLHQYIHASDQLKKALVNSRVKITVFIGVVMMLTLFLGALMYIIEGAENGFTSIPRAMYWAIVTLTTVGYGDIAPQTPIGQFIASVVMILGYGIIAVPTGIVTSEMAHVSKSTNTQNCQNCMTEDHQDDAKYCRNCGEAL